MKHNWEHKTLGESCIVIGGSTPKTDVLEYWGGQHNWFTPAELDSKKYYAESERKITDAAIKASGLTLMPKGTVLLTSRAPIGKIGITTEESFCNQGFKCLVCKDGLYNEYLYYTLQYFNSDIQEKGRSATFKEISKKVTESISIPVPPMSAQKHIAEELDEINAMIAGRKEQLRELDLLVQSIFYDMFGDPTTNAKNWDRQNLDSICNIVGRIGFRGYTRQDLVSKGEGAITLSPSNIYNGTLKYDQCSYISWYKYDESPEIQIFNGDVIFTKTGSTVGKVGIALNLPEKATLNPQLVVLKNLKQNNWYVSFVLRDSAYQELIREKSGGSAVPTMSQKFLGKLEIPIPPLSLQALFASKIEAIEEQKREIEASIRELKTLAQFIVNLSHRFNSENDLSDVTWTMCQTSDRFQCVFLKFFFPWLKKDCADVYITREQTNDDSRPDFVFEYGNEKYVIENKIGDRNHHFEQYLKTFKIEAKNLGYIANYNIVKSGFVAHTWKELYLRLQQKIPSEEKTLWEAYLQYIKSVCYIYLPTKPMDLNGMNSLYTFYRCLDDVFAFDNEYFHSELYDSRIDTKGGGNFQGTPREGIMGKYFELKYKGIRVKEAWGWMGVYFSEEEPTIWIGFRNEEYWGKPIFSLIDNYIDDIKAGRLHSAPLTEENAYWFKFRTPANFNELTLKRQEKLLKKFFEDVMMAIYNAKVLC